MQTAVVYQKNTGHVQVLHRTGAGIDESNADQINAAAGLPSFPVSCGSCYGPLSHEDLIGLYQGTIFTVKGYRCPACGHAVGVNRRKNANRSHIPFNWKRIDMPNKGRFEGRGDIL